MWCPVVRAMERACGGAPKRLSLVLSECSFGPVGSWSFSILCSALRVFRESVFVRLPRGVAHPGRGPAGAAPAHGRHGPGPLSHFSQKYPRRAPAPGLPPRPHATGTHTRRIDSHRVYLSSPVHPRPSVRVPVPVVRRLSLSLSVAVYRSGVHIAVCSLAACATAPTHQQPTPRSPPAHTSVRMVLCGSPLRASLTVHSRRLFSRRIAAVSNAAHNQPDRVVAAPYALARVAPRVAKLWERPSHLGCPRLPRTASRIRRVAL